jgi:acetolactate synthase-1/3 small subunit
MRIAGLIYRRNYNIASLSVSQTDTPGISRFTIMVDADKCAHEQVEKQLAKLVEVISVENLTQKGKFVERWLSLIKVRASVETRPHILQIAEVFRCRVVDMGSEALTLEVTGDEGKLRACTEALREYGILEIAGSGSVALGRAGFGGYDEIDGKRGSVSKYDMGVLITDGEVQLSNTYKS